MTQLFARQQQYHLQLLKYYVNKQNEDSDIPSLSGTTMLAVCALLAPWVITLEDCLVAYTGIPRQMLYCL
jgi:hypothetical protein